MRAPEDLLLEELRDIHNAERQLQRALPKLQRNIENDSLQSAMKSRLEQSQRLVEELDEAFEQMGSSKGRRKNAVVEGLIEETTELVDQIENPMLRSAAMIGAVQKLQHYCIAAWGTSRSMAQALGQGSVAESMQRALDEGKQQDQELTQVAEQEIYPALMENQETDQESGGRSQRTQGASQRDPSGARKTTPRKEQESDSTKQSSSGGQRGERS